MPNSRAFSASVSTCSARFGIGDAAAAVGGRHVVVDDGERLLRRAHLAVRDAQALEGLWARHLVHEVAVDIEEARCRPAGRRRRGRPRSCRRGFSGCMALSVSIARVPTVAWRGGAAAERSATEERAVGGVEAGEEARRQPRVVADRREGHRRMRHASGRLAPTLKCRQASDHRRYITAAARSLNDLARGPGVSSGWMVDNLDRMVG